jgi:hypothetical protein
MSDPGLALLGRLLDVSHDLASDALVAAVARAGQAMDAEDVAIYLVDYDFLTRRRQSMGLARRDAMAAAPTTDVRDPAAETMRRLAHAILVHQGRKPRDDATMVFLEWPGPPP